MQQFSGSIWLPTARPLPGQLRCLQPPMPLLKPLLPAACAGAGLVVEHSQNLMLQGLRVEETDYEGVRLRHNSTFNVVRVGGFAPALL